MTTEHILVTDETLEPEQVAAAVKEALDKAVVQLPADAGLVKVPLVYTIPVRLDSVPFALPDEAPPSYDLRTLMICQRVYEGITVSARMDARVRDQVQAICERNGWYCHEFREAYVVSKTKQETL